ncbi:MAG: hypothetical protein IPJ65_42030 [Archangiaceae bacterium]|nr:hypothetical protein [Archangiaceae bacterium]
MARSATTSSASTTSEKPPRTSILPATACRPNAVRASGAGTPPGSHCSMVPTAAAGNAIW